MSRKQLKKEKKGWSCSLILRLRVVDEVVEKVVEEVVKVVVKVVVEVVVEDGQFEPEFGIGTAA